VAAATLVLFGVEVGAGADTSWVPLQGIERTAVIVRVISPELVVAETDLQKKAEDLLRARNLLAPLDDVQHLLVYVDTLRIGGNCSDTVVLSLKACFSDVVSSVEPSRREMTAYTLCAWEHNKLKVVNRGSLATEVGAVVTTAVHEFAETLEKARAISGRTG